nr:MAG TPA: hypothetical protein [Caudoviricetes sp.]
MLNILYCHISSCSTSFYIENNLILEKNSIIYFFSIDFL